MASSENEKHAGRHGNTGQDKQHDDVQGGGGGGKGGGGQTKHAEGSKSENAKDAGTGGSAQAPGGA